MNVSEARRSRHLVIRLDRGDELPQALTRALNEQEARAGWIVGHGVFEAVELVTHAVPPRGRRRIEGLCEAVQITGSVAFENGGTTPRLTATLARETDLGNEVFAGQLTWARALAIELHVTVFDDLGLARVADEPSGLALLVGRSPAAPPLPAEPPAAPSPAARSTADAPRATPGSPGQSTELPTPMRYVRPSDEHEVYPEIGDAVTHFQFGECTVIQSDGDKIRLRQEKDGRVRELSLSVLRIEAPTELPDGRRHFKLQRKN